MNGSSLRKKSPGIRVTVSAPQNEKMKAVIAAGAATDQAIGTRREKLTAAALVPSIPASLLVPRSVAGAALPSTENNAGV